MKVIFGCFLCLILCHYGVREVKEKRIIWIDTAKKIQIREGSTNIRLLVSSEIAHSRHTALYLLCGGCVVVVSNLMHQRQKSSVVSVPCNERKVFFVEQFPYPQWYQYTVTSQGLLCYFTDMHHLLKYCESKKTRHVFMVTGRLHSNSIYLVRHKYENSKHE